MKASGFTGPREFPRASERALHDVGLQTALQRATTRFRDGRTAAIAEVPHWEELRQQAKAVKEDVLAHLDDYLEQLERSVTAAGGRVHWAADGESARRIILGIAREHGVKLVVKSKSMTSEEIDLDEALERAGIEPVETDLGEFIVQISGERPSHILAPAIHKTKEDVAALFERRLGAPYTELVEELTRTARGHLREKFLAADMGISGANFAVAETGTIVVVENEGNARMSTTLPPVHVALMGIEKVLPRLDDLATFLALLPRSASGQRMSSYVSLITGPRRAADVDGPRELHLVIMDNARSRMLGDPELRESLQCIRCGACLNVCPVYQRAGGHAYGWVYSGPIGAVITPQLRGVEEAGELPFASSLCGACLEACPVAIDLPRMLLALRQRVVQQERAAGAPRWWERWALAGWARAMSSARLYAVGARAARLASFRGRTGGRIHRLPGPFRGWTESRDFPPLAGESFREWWRAHRGGDTEHEA